MAVRRYFRASIVIALIVIWVASCSSIRLKDPEGPLAFDPVGTYHLVPIKDLEPARRIGLSVSVTGVSEFRREQDGRLSFSLLMMRVTGGIADEVRYLQTPDSDIRTSPEEILITNVKMIATRPDGTTVPYLGTTSVIFRLMKDGLTFESGRILYAPEFYFRKIEPPLQVKQGPPPTFRGSVFLVDPPANRISLVGEQIPERLRTGSTITIVRKGQIVARGTVAQVFPNRAIVTTGNANSIQPRDEAFGWK